MLLLLITSIITLINITNGQNPSPCPEIFTYDRNKSENDRWYGTVSIRSREDLTGIYINVILDRAAQLLGNWFGDVTSQDNIEYTIVNQKYKLEAGPPVSIRFFVKFNPALTVPSVKTIRLNGRTICSTKTSEIVQTTTERLKISQTRSTTRRPETRTTRKATYRPSSYQEERPANLGGNNLGSIEEQGDDDSFYESEILGILRPQNRPNFDKKPSQSPNALHNNNCGTVISSANALVSHGQESKPGQWPWHAALYYSKGIQLIYTCGATLITNQHVLTAAHCVTKPHTAQMININNVRAYFGKHNLINFGNEVQERGLEEIYLHPYYNYSTYFNDIAVLKLSKPVEITNYVRTACLWSEDDNLENIIDRPGTVVGWGFDQNRRLSNTLMQAQMPIVSTVTCIYSNRDFFSRFTFENNFCAGFRNGTSVCNGDSGGGMVFPKSGTSGKNTVWQIRGIVSVGVALQGEGLCDTSQYIVFTDVAKYLHWIRQVVAL